MEKVLRLLLPAILAVSCDPFDRELSEREARAELVSLFEISSPQDSTVALAPDSANATGIKIAIDAGALEGLWQRVPWRDYAKGKVTAIELNEKGKQFFKSVELNSYSSTAELARPLTRTVENVREVSEGGAEQQRVVDFTYRWDAPATVLRYIGERSGEISGRARFERIEGRWQLLEIPLREYGPFRRDPESEAPGRAEQEERCRESGVEREVRGTYRFTHRSTPRDVAFFELQVSDVGFTVTRRFESSGRSLQTLSRSHYWGDVLGLDIQGGRIEMTVLMYRDRTIDRLDFSTYRIEIEDDGKALPPLSEASEVMSQAWTDWHQRFFDCLPEPANPWMGR